MVVRVALDESEVGGRFAVGGRPDFKLESFREFFSPIMGDFGV